MDKGRTTGNYRRYDTFKGMVFVLGFVNVVLCLSLAAMYAEIRHLALSGPDIAYCKLMKYMVDHDAANN